MMIRHVLAAAACLVSIEPNAAAPHELPPLPYSTSALEPYINRQTLEIHHGKHHAKYVAQMNEKIKGTKLEGKSLEEIVKTSYSSNDKALFNNAAQAWNHDFYWKCMAPPSASGGSYWRKKTADSDATNEPEKDSKIGKAIKKSFGSYKAFRNMFVKAANTQFGSGWAWLVYDSKNDALLVTKTSNADNPMTTKGYVPLLTIDVWEHAYYLNYQNMRPTYVDTFLDKLVSWDFVEKNLVEAIGSGSSRLTGEL